MQRSHAVYADTVMNVDIRHMNTFIFVNNMNLGIVEFPPYLIVKHLNNRNQLRHDIFQIVNRPLFQSLGKNGVVGVGTRSANRFYRIVHLQTALDQ